MKLLKNKYANQFDWTPCKICHLVFALTLWLPFFFLPKEEKNPFKNPVKTWKNVIGKSLEDNRMGEKAMEIGLSRSEEVWVEEQS